MINKIKILPILLFFHSALLMAQYDFSADATDGCDSLTVHFTFISTASVDTITNIIWDLGKPKYDTTHSVSEVLTTKFTIPTNYPIIVYINNADDPPVAVKNNYISVHRTVTADFTRKDTSQVAPDSYFYQHVDQPFDIFTTYNYNWNFGDGTNGAGEDIIHTFTTPGTFSVSLNVIDGYGCTDTKSQSITILPPPPAPDIIADETDGCDTLQVKFNLVNVDTDTITSIAWNFGNGATSALINPDTVEFLAGSMPLTDYSVQVIINGDAANSIVKTDYITLHRSVRALFNCVDTLANSDNIIKVCYSLDQLFDTAADYQFTWHLEGFTDNNDVRPLYTFSNEPDTVIASLTIDDLTYGCSNMHVQNIILAPEVTVQNVFTPNNDGINDFFIINTNGGVRLTMKVYSRSGLLLFEDEGTEIVWSGRTESGIELGTGIYYYVLVSSEIDDPLGKYNKTGFIYLFR